MSNDRLFSSRISTGTIDKILTTAGDALAVPYADLLDRGNLVDVLGAHSRCDPVPLLT